MEVQWQGWRQGPCPWHTCSWSWAETQCSPVHTLHGSVPSSPVSNSQIFQPAGFWVVFLFFFFVFYSFDMCSGLQYVNVWVAVTVIIPRTIFLVNSSRKCFLFWIDLLFFLPLLFGLLNPAMLLTRLWVVLGIHWLKGWGIELDEPFCFLDYIFQLRLPEC